MVISLGHYQLVAIICIKTQIKDALIGADKISILHFRVG